jgi:hypothetical protein
VRPSGEVGVPSVVGVTPGVLGVVAALSE